jgi:hypothetical protein
MTKSKFYERVDLTYIIGAAITLSLSIISLILKQTGFPIIFPIVSCLTYIGVIFRGIIDQDSWGKTLKQRKNSAIVGLISIFAIFYIESLSFLLSSSFFASPIKVVIIFFEGILLSLVYKLIYEKYFRRAK